MSTPQPLNTSLHELELSNGGFIPEKTIFPKFLDDNRPKIRFLGLFPEQRLSLLDEYLMDGVRSARIALEHFELSLDRRRKTRGWTEVQIANQFGTSAAEVGRATAEFKRLPHLDSAGSIQAIPRRLM